MNKYFIAALATAVAVTANTAQAQSNVATQSVAFEVAAINSISLSGSPSLTINAAVAGSAPTSVTSGGTYSVSTNESNRKITASIGSNMASGVTLSVLLVAPSGASASSRALTSVAQDVVTGIATLDAAGLAVTYTLSATSAAGVIAAGTRTVTYTLMTGA